MNITLIFATLKIRLSYHNMGNVKAIQGALAIAAIALFASCGKEQASNLVSDRTGWNFNDPKLGGYEVTQWQGQITPPGMAFIEGGRFTMGRTDEDLLMEENNTPHNVTVSSFYMDQAEVANVNYREYCYWVTRVYGQDYPNLIYSTLPDTTCWRKAMSYNEPLVKNYFRQAAYNYYPVVGVTYKQANDYCAWRTDRINEIILIKAGYLKKNYTQTADENFTYDSYLSGQYLGTVGVKRKDIDPTGSGSRPIRMEDGLLMPDVRLPTEAEWEYAALALVGNNPDPDTKRRRGEEVVTDRQVYPWGDNNSTREGLRNQYQGEQLANFVRANGDYAGVAGGLNDHAFIPAPVYSYKPNAYGLYNMAGNVSEWVMDVYRADMPGEGLNPVRQTEIKVGVALEDGSLEEKDSTGRMPFRQVTQEELADKYTDIRNGYLADYEDGDTSMGAESTRAYTYQSTDGEGGRPMSTLVTNESYVIKGGSWNDRAYYLSPGTRRYMQARHSSSTVGFRCVVDRLAAPTISSHAGNFFNGKSKR
jgi:sulfatase modifying factor 1